MDKEAQDQLWSILSEETKEEYRQKYKFHLADSEREMKCNDDGYDLTVLRSHVIVDELVNMFGSHNLNPEPVKKEGWVIIGKHRDELILDNTIYSTKADAENIVTTEGWPIIAIAKIEWEELI